MAQNTVRNNKKVTMNENELEKMTIYEEDEAQIPTSAVTDQVLVAKTRPNLTWQMSTPVSLSRHSALKSGLTENSFLIISGQVFFFIFCQRSRERFPSN